MKPARAELSILIIIAASLHLTCCSATANRSILCHENEKQALLRFKHMYQNSSKLSSWKSEVDCCSWESVVCNNITGHVVELSLNDSGLTGELDDHFLLSLTHLTYLDLSYNDFQGALPRAANITKLQYFDISNNDFNSIIPEWLFHCKYLQHLDLNVNGFQGALPRAANITKLQYFDISVNDFNSTIPEWLFHCKYLQHLDLNLNRFQGSISNSIGNLTYLKILDLSSNMLSGEIPNSIGKLCVEYLILSNNKLGGDIINIILPRYESATVSTKGTRLYYDTILSLVTNIDLSSNNFSGDIPKQLTSLAELRSLNLSRNHLNGKIPDGMEGMKVLESLDLSNNLLSGNIPHSIAFLSPLNYLDLSYNNLSGEIPQSTQFSTFNASSFVGNNLCGPPLTISCNGGEIPARSVPGGHDKDGDGKSEIEWLYVFVSLGYAVGLAVVCNLLVFKKSWRDAFFGSVDNMWNKLFAKARKERSRRG